MSSVSELRSKLQQIEHNLEIYDKSIEEIKKSIDGIISTLKNNAISLESNIWDKLLNQTPTTIPLNSLYNIPKNSSKDGEIIDYSVSSRDLSLKETISVNGKKVGIYTSGKTDALYVISSGLNQRERKELSYKLKDHLSNDQMAILTYDGDCYHYDSTNRLNCTANYSLVGKDLNGKMYSFQMTDNSEIVVDNGSKNDTLITTVNGMVIGNKMHMTMEANAEVEMNVRPKSNVDGGQVVTEFERLSFSGGTSLSTGNQFAEVSMKGNWQQYANTAENRQNGTWLNEHAGNNVVQVGNGPQGAYASRYHTVGHVDTPVIPVIVKAGNRAGSQRMQGTVCYHHDGNRPGYMSKDMLGFSQKVVTSWENI